VAHRHVDKVSLTGSVPTGRRVMAEAGAGVKHATMELGGKSPLIIFADAELEDAIGAAMLGNFYSAGQVCSNGTRVFVHRSLKSRFLDRLAERTSRIIIGDPLDETTQMGPLISAAQFEKVLSYVAIGKQEGARLICGGGKASAPGFDKGFFVQPAIFADVADSMRIASEEIFGPVMCVLDFDDEDEVVSRANASAFGLAAGVFTKDLARAHRVAAALEAGICWINTYNRTPVEAPFGGSKLSGVGRENSMAAIEHYSQLKSVYVASGPVESPY
jgi:betaine-aldehyde dehydrogenase